MTNGSLFIAEVDGKGRGVFTTLPIAADTVVEVAPVIVMSAADRLLLDQTLLHDYIFEWQPDGRHLCCMALGWVPIYNHSNYSNCEYVMDYDTDTIVITTMRNIAAGEELTINYTGDWDSQTPVWFDMKEDD